MALILIRPGIKEFTAASFIVARISILFIIYKREVYNNLPGIARACSPRAQTLGSENRLGRSLCQSFPPPDQLAQCVPPKAELYVRSSDDLLWPAKASGEFWHGG